MGKAQSAGKDFERFIFCELKELQKTCPLFVHRFVDSHEAGRFVSPQPSDFLISTKSLGTAFVEVKSSAIYITLANSPRTMISPQQIGKLMMIDRAHQPIYCIFFSHGEDEIEIWKLNGALNSIVDSNHLDVRYKVGKTTLEGFKEFVKRVLL